jgi:hypothetical protein
MKLKPAPELVADLMLFYCEQACQFSYDYGDMWDAFYTAVENNFARTVDFLKKNGLLDANENRIKQLIRLTSPCGWGFPDTMQDIYDEALCG